MWCTFGFIEQVILPFLSGMRSALFFVIDFILLFFGLLCLKRKSDKIFVCSFLAVSYYITCAHCESSFVFYVNGLRDFAYIICIVPFLRYLYQSKIADEFVRKMDKTLYVFLVVQAFCVFFQFIKYGANDHGGGSMGLGFSGIVSMMIYLISFYLMKKKMTPNNYWQSIIRNKWLVILLLPTFFNETKISFIFLPLYFLLLLPLNKTTIVKMLFAVPLIAFVMYMLFNVYLSVTGADDDILTLEYYTEMYLMAGEDNDIVDWVEFLHDHGEELAIDGSNDIPRFTKYMMIPELNAYYPGHDITGYGIGHFKGGTTIENSKFYIDNEWLLKGSIPYGYHFYIQLGLFSIIFFVWLWWILCGFKQPNSKVDVGIIVYVGVMTILVLFYNDFFRYCLLSFVFIYIFTQALRWESLKIAK